MTRHAHTEGGLPITNLDRYNSRLPFQQIGFVHLGQLNAEANCLQGIVAIRVVETEEHAITGGTDARQLITRPPPRQ